MAILSSVGAGSVQTNDGYPVWIEVDSGDSSSNVTADLFLRWDTSKSSLNTGTQWNGSAARPDYADQSEGLAAWYGVSVTSAATKYGVLLTSTNTGQTAALDGATLEWGSQESTFPSTTYTIPS